MTLDPPTTGPAAPTSRRLFRMLSRTLKGCFALAVVAFWILFVQRHWSSLTANDWTLDVPWAVAAFLAFVLYWLVQGVGWVMLTRAMGYRLPVAGGTGVWLLSMPARYLPGNVWHIAARVSLAARYQVTAEGVVVSSAAEQLLMVLSAACLGLAWLPSWANAGSSPRTGVGSLPWALAFLLACLAGLQPPVLRFFLRLGSRLLGKTMLAPNLGYRRLALLLIWYSLVNALNGLAFALLTTASARSPETLWPIFAGAYCLAYVVGYVSFLTPSGIGVREAALASMLGLYLPVPTAVAISILARLLSTAGEAAAVLGVGLPVAAIGKRS